MFSGTKDKYAVQINYTIIGKFQKIRREKSKSAPKL